MTRRSMSAWGFAVLVGLGLAGSPRLLRGQYVPPGMPATRVGVTASPSYTTTIAGPASEVQLLALEDRDRRQEMEGKARALLTRLQDRAEELRESLRKAEAEVAAATELVEQLTAANRPAPPAAPAASTPAVDVNGWEYSNNLAWGWATAADPARRDGPKALEFAKKACELTGDQNPLCLDTLAAAYAEVGNFAQAIAVQARAVQVGGADHADDFKARLRLYIDAKPYHEPAPAPAPR